MTWPGFEVNGFGIKVQGLGLQGMVLGVRGFLQKIGGSGAARGFCKG